MWLGRRIFVHNHSSSHWSHAALPMRIPDCEAGLPGARLLNSGEDTWKWVWRCTSVHDYVSEHPFICPLYQTEPRLISPIFIVSINVTSFAVWSISAYNEGPDTSLTWSQLYFSNFPGNSWSQKMDWLMIPFLRSLTTSIANSANPYNRFMQNTRVGKYSPPKIRSSF